MRISDWSSDVCSSDLIDWRSAKEDLRETSRSSCRPLLSQNPVPPRDSFRRDPRLVEHVALAGVAVLVRGRACLGLLALVEAVPHFVPVPPRGGLRILRRALFEEVGVLDAVEQDRKSTRLNSSH